MSLIELFILAVGLSMDAFAVAVCKGLSMRQLNKKHAVLIGLYFGGFQAAMPLLGYYLGYHFKDAIVSVDHWVAFILLAIIGANMVKESLTPCEEEELVAVMSEAVRLAELRESGRLRRESGAAQEVEASPEMAVYEEGDPNESRMAQVAPAILTYIRDNYMKEISMQDAARAMNYSDAYFCKLFKQCFDQNFTTYLTNFRVNEAKKLLRNHELNVKEISARVGYSDSNYFSKVFKRMTGMIPSEFRDSQM